MSSGDDRERPRKGNDVAQVEKRGDRKYRARHRGPDGKEHSQTFTTRRDAERWVNAQQNAKQQGGWVDPSLGRMTFAEWARRGENPRLICGRRRSRLTWECATTTWYPDSVPGRSHASAPRTCERWSMTRPKPASSRGVRSAGTRSWSFGPPKTKAGIRTVTMPAALADVLG